MLCLNERRHLKIHGGGEGQRGWVWSSPLGSVHVSQPQAPTVSGGGVSHGDAVTVQQVGQPLLPALPVRVPLEDNSTQVRHTATSAASHNHRSDTTTSSAISIKFINYQFQLFVIFVQNREQFNRRGVSEGFLVYRELLDDVLQQGGVGQQVAAERRMLQHHGQHQAQLRQLLLTEVPDPQNL